MEAKKTMSCIQIAWWCKVITGTIHQPLLSPLHFDVCNEWQKKTQLTHSFIFYVCAGTDCWHLGVSIFMVRWWIVVDSQQITQITLVNNTNPGTGYFSVNIHASNSHWFVIDVIKMQVMVCERTYILYWCLRSHYDWLPWMNLVWWAFIFNMRYRTSFDVGHPCSYKDKVKK